MARDWFDDASDDARFIFCRYTQIGLLRLISMPAVMGRHAMNQPTAWKTYDRWLADSRVSFAEEPAGVESFFRTITTLRRPAPKHWPDAYIAAFAIAAELTLVTFDRALGAKAKGSILLGE